MDVSALQVVSMVFGSLITLLLMHREAAWMGSRNRRPEILLILVSDVFGSPARTGMGDLINMQSVFLGAVPQSFIIMKEQNAGTSAFEGLILTMLETPASLEASAWHRIRGWWDGALTDGKRCPHSAAARTRPHLSVTDTQSCKFLPTLEIEHGVANKLASQWSPPTGAGCLTWLRRHKTTCWTVGFSIAVAPVIDVSVMAFIPLWFERISDGCYATIAGLNGSALCRSPPKISPLCHSVPNGMESKRFADRTDVLSI
ncbi:predicted protein [Coccidioides posadasii str. Silveira]|uniref:Predicted protein n=1 Tax=Coccidioides posadasii (strain RMSCC 757 / Silveira) TaxID=443226 RepID=E9D9G1_COCPS|nr:predicted protein [Coccidioides posadasii str. Silveira]